MDDVYHNIIGDTEKGFSWLTIFREAHTILINLANLDGKMRLLREKVASDYPASYNNGRRDLGRTITYYDTHGNPKPPTRLEFVNCNGATPQLIQHVTDEREITREGALTQTAEYLDVPLNKAKEGLTLDLEQLDCFNRAYEEALKNNPKASQKVLPLIALLDMPGHDRITDEITRLIVDVHGQKRTHARCADLSRK